MEYYNNKIITLLDNTPNQPSKSRTKNGVEIKDGSRHMRRLTQVYVIIVMYIFIYL